MSLRDMMAIGAGALTKVPRSMQGWWVSPIVTQTAGHIYAGSSEQRGGVLASLCDAGVQPTTKIFGRYEVDDHNVPAIIQLPNGKMFAAWARHSILGVLQIYKATSATSDALDFGAVSTLATSDVVTYMQLHVVGSRVWMLYRIGSSLSGGWAIRYSDDNGATWSAEVIFTTIPYLISKVVGTTMRCVAYDHPITGADHDIFALRINLTTGDVADDNSVSLGNILTNTGLPALPGECHKIVDVTDPTTTRLYALRDDGQAILASEFTTVNAGTYYRYVYNTATGLYTKQTIAASGPAFFTDSAYFGGCCFDPGNANVVYVARNLGASVGVGSWVLERRATSDGGTTWPVTHVIRQSNEILCRPLVAAGRIWWSEVPVYPNFFAFEGDLRYAALPA